MPEPAASRRIRPRAAGGAWDIRSFATLDSTNRYVLDAARHGEPEGVVAVADHQTAGRGRLGRRWVAAPGSALLASVLLRPAVGVEDLARCTAGAGLSLAVAVERLAGVRAELKWPNDLVVADRKLAGLLAEADLGAGAVRAVVVGAGCNLTALAIPSDLTGAATSVETEGGAVPAAADLLDAYLDELDRVLGDLSGVPAAARARSATIGRRVRVELGVRQAIEGRALDVTDSGALLVRDGSGTVHTVAVGDVVHLRTVPEDR
jgi:BirA family biotin operon repressor/biotin-[acetyl-CoA-carboxylase] ligase